MLARTHSVLVAAVLVIVSSTACVSSGYGTLSEPRRSTRVSPLTPTSRVIDAEGIGRSGARSALDAVRALVPSLRLGHHREGTVAWLRAGTISRGTLRVIVDGHPTGDMESLRMIPARELVAIHVLSGPDATVRFGPSYDGGVIIIQTRSTLRPL